MESTINVAFKSCKVIVIAEVALKVKLAPEIIHIAALAPPTLLFESVSPFDLKKMPHAGGEESSFSSNPLYDQPEAIFIEEEFPLHVHNNVSTPSSPSVSQKSFSNVLVTRAEGEKRMEEIIAELQ
ncbi:hypothetical protein MRB53_005558 [Persea americana]|uniref:Uncharacterized protein n=1 Tax=Persea americana TaxID=3435 RepID=A0ACC2MDN2_PERAE|nr:hypothetical protein MRB53_005558 [Persea americana]